MELGGGAWSWVEVDGAGWRWVHGLAMPNKLRDIQTQFHLVFFLRSSVLLYFSSVKLVS